MVDYALISVLKRLKQKDYEFKASLNYINRCCPEKFKEKKKTEVVNQEACSIVTPSYSVILFMCSRLLLKSPCNTGCSLTFGDSLPPLCER